jgi:hypothetical protein
MVSRSWRARIGLGVGLYAALWAFTQVVGVPRVLAEVAVHHLPSNEQVKAPGQRAHCGAFAIAPFLIKADFSYYLAPLAGGAGTIYYAWVGGAAHEAFLGPQLAR